VKRKKRVKLGGKEGQKSRELMHLLIEKLSAASM
jgi:hypothetical protein